MRLDSQMGELNVWAAAWQLLPWLSSEELGKEYFGAGIFYLSTRLPVN